MFSLHGIALIQPFDKWSGVFARSVSIGRLVYTRRPLSWLEALLLILMFSYSGCSGPWKFFIAESALGFLRGRVFSFIEKIWNYWQAVWAWFFFVSKRCSQWSVAATATLSQLFVSVILIRMNCILSELLDMITHTAQVLIFAFEHWHMPVIVRFPWIATASISVDCTLFLVLHQFAWCWCPNWLDHGHVRVPFWIIYVLFRYSPFWFHRVSVIQSGRRKRSIFQ